MHESDGVDVSVHTNLHKISKILSFNLASENSLKSEAQSRGRRLLSVCFRPRVRNSKKFSSRLVEEREFEAHLAIEVILLFCRIDTVIFSILSASLHPR